VLYYLVRLIYSEYVVICRPMEQFTSSSWVRDSWSWQLAQAQNTLLYFNDL